MKDHTSPSGLRKLRPAKTAARAAALALALVFASHAHAQTNGTWNTNASGNWSLTNNWLSGLVANGAGSTANLTFNITAAAAVSIDTAVTLGSLSIGDSTHAYTLQLSTGSLAFNNNGSGATITNTAAPAAGQTISANFSLDDNLTVNNTVANPLALSGAISDGTNGAKSVTINSSGAGRINASGANAFSGGLYVNSGYYYGQTSANAFGGNGTGAVYLGDTTGTANATLRGGSVTFANAITVRSGSSNNTLTIIGVGGGGTTTFSGGVTLNKDVTLDSSKGVLTFSTAGLSGNGTITVTNSDGTSALSTHRVELTAANTNFTGNVNVNGAVATLRVGNTSALNSNNTVKVSSGLFELNANQTIAGLNDNAGVGGAVSVATANRTLTLGGSGSYSFNGTLRDTNTLTLALTKSGTGLQALGGSNTYTGTTTVSGGVLKLDSANALPGGIGATGGLSALVLDGGVIGLASGDFNRNIVGLTPGATDVGWLANGSGGFAAFGANRNVNFGGAGASVTWSASGGVFGTNLILSDALADAIVTILNPINLNSGTRNVTVNDGSAALDATLGGSIAGGGTLVKRGAGVLALTASNSIGTFDIVTGTLRASHIDAFGTASGVTVVQLTNSTTLELDANVTLGGGLKGDGGTVTAVNGNRTLTVRETNTVSQTFSGTLQDGGANALSLTKTGSGTQVLAGNNTYSGVTTISTGTLQIGNGGTSGSIGSTSGVTNDGTITYNRSDNLTASYGISGNGNLIKSGSGTLTLSGNNTFVGSTTVTNGILALDRTGGGALSGTTSIGVGTGATLLVSQSYQVNNTSATVTLSGGTIQRANGVSEVFGNLSLGGDSFLDFGTGTAGTITFGTYTPSALLTVQNFLPGNTLIFKSNLSGSISNTSSFQFSGGFTSIWDQPSSTFTITAVPEASTYFAATGLIGMMLWPARRRLMRDVKSILGTRRRLKNFSKASAPRPCATQRMRPLSRSMTTVRNLPLRPE